MTLAVAAAGCVVLCACARPRASMEQLESTDAGQRIAAIVDLTNRAGQGSKPGQADPKASDLIPRLVDRLDDEDEGVRFYAILGLEKLTGTRLGYRYGDLTTERRAAVDRWRAFVAQGAEPDVSTPAAGEETGDAAGRHGDGHP